MLLLLWVTTMMLLIVLLWDRRGEQHSRLEMCRSGDRMEREVEDEGGREDGGWRQLL